MQEIDIALKQLSQPHSTSRRAKADISRMHLNSITTHGPMSIQSWCLLQHNLLYYFQMYIEMISKANCVYLKTCSLVFQRVVCIWQISCRKRDFYFDITVLFCLALPLQMYFRNFPMLCFGVHFVCWRCFYYYYLFHSRHNCRE